MHELATKRLLIVSGAVIAAVFLGTRIADASYFLPTVAAIGSITILFAWKHWQISAVVMAATLFGYIVGNRGFAQAMPIKGIPLFAAEIALMVGVVILLFRAAVAKERVIRRDSLNVFVLLWLIIGGGRLPLDVRSHGIMAVRDSAMVYYALFFFIGQFLAADERARRWLSFALSAGLSVLVPAFIAYTIVPEWFYNNLLFHGVPLIIYKGDIAATMLAAGVFHFYGKVGISRKAWPAVIACFLGAVYPLTRAAIAGMAAAACLHVAARRWRMLVVLAVTAGITGLANIGWTIARGRPVNASRAFQIIEYAGSALNLTDAGKLTSYTGEGDVKGNPIDNNQFRWIWWRTVAEDTWRENPWYGAGFGHDLASRFLIEYGITGDAEFSARSPHSFVMSTFGRLGLVGLLTLVGMLVAMAARTSQAVSRWRTDEAFAESVATWSVCWVIFVSACFGVVLEGPMGAVIFWTVLGMAAAGAPRTARAEDRESTTPDAGPGAKPLPAAQPSAC